ncbi:phage tail protein [Yersinia kristensenii]|uniref:Putative bacteriophage tail fiber protein n=1 Tax=Yersinia kristensenii TaxID=28152 RepID=A0A0T9KYN8_YERKR|nr:phage tail protein [Yersinia kristensenii]CNE41974.1 putative bacteriophage tail fiber protein [Yersinia kristensenii]
MQKIGSIPNTRADSNGEFTDGNVAGGVPPTILPAEWFNTIQRELINILAAAGITPDSKKFDQMALAISTLVSKGEFLKIKNNLSEIKTAGPSAVAAALDNLGISANLIPVGTPIPWPTATPPTGWLKCNGNSFSATTYPKLALVYPSGVLPDLRGEFIRGWDDGRGVDAARALLSAQGDAMRNLTGSFSGTTNNDASSVFGVSTGIFAGSTTLLPATNATAIGSNTRPATMSINASLQVPTANENRPRNIAFNYIVRAA